MAQDSLSELTMPTPSYQASAIDRSLAPSRTEFNLKPTVTNAEECQQHMWKRQQKKEDQNGTVVVKPTQSVVHVTITAAGTVVYTQTSTSYSYIESYIPATNIPSATNRPATGNSNGSSTGSKSNANLGAIIGGAVGGVAAIALVGLLFFLIRRHKRKKNSQSNMLYDDDDSYYRGHQGNAALNREGLMADDEKDGSRGNTIAGGSTVSPSPRHLVAPLQPSMATISAGATTTVGSDNEAARGDGNRRVSKYYPSAMPENGYYTAASYSVPYYSTANSVVSDSMPSSTVDGSQYNHTGGAMNAPPLSYPAYLQVPNEIDYHSNETLADQHNANTNEIRHVPHLKDDAITTITEPPHSKD